MKSRMYLSYQAITPHAHKTILENYKTKGSNLGEEEP
jgi:hypothetical protein